MALRPDSLNIISLCTGGGGLDLGIELAIPNARTVCMVEREAFAIATLVSAMEAGLLAQAPVWSDVRTFDGGRFRGCVDGVIGGIPCQPHSVAGRKRGSLDARDLWSDARRIIVQSRVWFVLIENVAGMLSAGDDQIAGAERIWRDLHKLGFAVEIGLFRASEVGAPHERERIFILGVADDAMRTGRTSELRGASLEYAALFGRGEWRPEPIVRSGRNSVAGADSAMADADEPQFRGEPPAGEFEILQRDHASRIFPPGPGDIDSWREILRTAPGLEPAIRRLPDGLATSRIDWLRLLGNGVVPLQSAYAIRTLVSRLAAKGSTGAARLVRMMEAAA